MIETRNAAIDLILRHEGGYVDHPNDPGGCTKHGITLATLRRLSNPSATCRDVRDLPASIAREIYRETYWQAVGGDELPWGVDLVVFDHGVNAGPRRAIELLQRTVGAYPDGILGPVTLLNVDRHAPLDLIKRLSAARLSYYQRLKHWRTFGRGWSRRVQATRDAALDLAVMAIAGQAMQVAA